MTDSRDEASGSRGVSRPRRDSISPRRGSSSRYGSSTRDRHRQDDEEHRHRRSRSHRQESSRGNRKHRRNDDDSRHRTRDTNDDYGSKRRRDEERQSSTHRSHRAEGERHTSSRTSSHKGSDGHPRSHRHDASSDRRDRDSRTTHQHDRSDRSRPRSPSPSDSPVPRATSSGNRSSTRQLSPIAPQSFEPPEEERDEDAPNFAPSGLLAAESNTVNGVALKYHEPPEARKPKSAWRLYCFKDGKEQQVLHLGAQSAYLLGRDRTVTDIPLDHESCSKQHAVLQFRQTTTTNEYGDKKKRIHPFLIDLESSNGSYVNDNEIPTSRYYQLRTGDTLTFGASTREYVLLDESSA